MNPIGAEELRVNMPWGAPFAALSDTCRDRQLYHEQTGSSMHEDELSILNSVLEYLAGLRTGFATGWI
ncbi:hypothetical protein F9C07_8375 [Aspergillus flavus]|uniref:Uncharacterized protein n=1 Tax=Aspergillus flavus (strain ATCC 200026 / FGSC A1120 / IAM 13836 / NRRL 3357 / JCM 12722 / SRRC 167) TaxID=332952 RepID=A0A7U2N1Q8_ASPFN|nr:hypothetical protein AFLA70_635g000300 [Aspergillus flavus AF70]QRD93923.1 hypothetical protein F9C07_8375 [Aspergillus flavus]